MVPPGRSLAILVLLATALALLAIGVSSDGTEAQLPTITVDLDDGDKEQDAFPTDTENDILEFDGCLTLNRPFWPPGTSVVITMEIVMSGVDVVWESNIDPPTHTFAVSESQSFKALVTVPEGLPATTTIGFALEFTASTEDILLPDITSDTARVNIAHYYKIHRYYSTEPINIRQGDVVDFNFTVENAGNGDDSFIFEVGNEAELLFAGLTLIYDTSKRVPMGGEENVRLQLTAATDALEGQFMVNLTITSEGSKTDPNYDDPVMSSAEWNVLVEPSIGSTIRENIIYIILGVVVLVVIIAVLVVLKKRRRAREEDEDSMDEEEEEPAPKKKRKKRPRTDAGDGDDEG